MQITAATYASLVRDVNCLYQENFSDAFRNHVWVAGVDDTSTHITVCGRDCNDLMWLKLETIFEHLQLVPENVDVPSGISRNYTLRLHAGLEHKCSNVCNKQVA